MTKTRLTAEQAEFKFRLLEQARNILTEAQPFLLRDNVRIDDYAGKVIDLAERINHWIFSINETK